MIDRNIRDISCADRRISVTEAMIDRRNLLAAGAIMTVGAAALAPAVANAAATTTPSASSGYAPQAVPLPFDPKLITGLSEKLLVSYHDNNYVGAVKRRGSIEGQIAALDPASAPSFLINGLKRVCHCGTVELRGLSSVAIVVADHKHSGAELILHLSGTRRLSR